MVSFNNGKSQNTFYKSICHASPGKSLKSLEARRYAKNTQEVMARRGSARKKKIIIVYIIHDHYGKECQRPDMDAADFEQGKQLFLKNLQEQAQKFTESP